MLPLILGLAGLGALQGSMAAKARAKENQRNADISAAQMQYSPWTGITPQQFQYQAPNATGQMLGGAAKGALTGYLMTPEAAAGSGAAGSGAAASKLSTAPAPAPLSTLDAGNSAGMNSVWGSMDPYKKQMLYGMGYGNMQS